MLEKWVGLWPGEKVPAVAGGGWVRLPGGVSLLVWLTFLLWLAYIFSFLEWYFAINFQAFR